MYTNMHTHLLICVLNALHLVYANNKMLLLLICDWISFTWQFFVCYLFVNSFKMYLFVCFFRYIIDGVVVVCAICLCVHLVHCFLIRSFLNYSSNCKLLNNKNDQIFRRIENCIFFYRTLNFENQLEAKRANRSHVKSNELLRSKFLLETVKPYDIKMKKRFTPKTHSNTLCVYCINTVTFLLVRQIHTFFSMIIIIL